VKGGAGTGGDGGGSNRRVGAKSTKGEEAGGLVEAEAGPELAGGGTEETAAEGGVKDPKTVEFDGDGGFAGRGADGAASATDGLSGKKQLREDAVEFCLPAGLFFACQLGEVGEGLVEARVIDAELGEEFVADFIAGEGRVGIGGVLAPGLVDRFKEDFDLGAASLQEGTEDIAFWLGEDGMDSAETFGPGPAEKLHEDGLCLIVEGVGGEDAVGVAGGQEVVEEVIAGVAGGLLDGLGVAVFASFGNTRGYVSLVEVEGDVEVDAEVFNELLVSVGFFAAEVVVDVDGAETYA
jgi:hypothetical protein